MLDMHRLGLDEIAAIGIDVFSDPDPAVLAMPQPSVCAEIPGQHEYSGVVGLHAPADAMRTMRAATSTDERDHTTVAATARAWSAPSSTGHLALPFAIADSLPAMIVSRPAAVCW